jgi:hypothetical protein
VARGGAVHAAVIRALGTRVVGDVIEIGRRLADCRDNHCKHGEWLPWIEREFGWSDQTARNFIHVFELSLTEFKTILNLAEPIDIRDIYLLAAPSTPDEARTAVIDLAANGEHLTHARSQGTLLGVGDHLRGGYVIEGDWPVDIRVTLESHYRSCPKQSIFGGNARSSASMEAQPSRMIGNGLLESPSRQAWAPTLLLDKGSRN